jgi:hypothetical protein
MNMIWPFENVRYLPFTGIFKRIPVAINTISMPWLKPEIFLSWIVNINASDFLSPVVLITTGTQGIPTALTQQPVHLG